MIGPAIFLSFAVLLLVGTPIAICLGTSSVLGMLIDGSGKPIEAIMTTLPRIFSSATSKFVLLAVPFFILGGNVMEKAGISERLINFAQSCVGHLRGGLIVVMVSVACFFAAISGSGPATVAALGMILIPAMVNVGYPPAFAAALMAAAGATGIVIPPSITFVVYGSVADTSIGKLFLAGINPGLLIGLALIIVSIWTTRNMDIELLPKATAAERWKSFKDAFWGLLMPLIILGGIYGGIFTPTEAAAASAVYGLFVGFFIYKTLKLKDLYEIFVNSTTTTAVVMFITATASLFAYILTRARLDLAISNGLTEITGGNYIMFLLIANIIFLIAGCFMDATSAVLIFTPLFLPVALSLGIDPIHFGAVMVLNLSIGLVTPPVGINLFVGCGIANITLKDISVAVIPLIIACLIVLLAVTYIPFISLMFV
ncbi:MAG: TRAP transporter large permease [Selenomonadaceae bacterium]|nr:TRAP transporter large permease [Selenomonadaceae bacterium]MBR1859197.1 TRAP transporter large permease [Selenomonadaceae bacterium]